MVSMLFMKILIIRDIVDIMDIINIISVIQCPDKQISEFLSGKTPWQQLKFQRLKILPVRKSLKFNPAII